MGATTPVVFFETSTYAREPVFHLWGKFDRIELPDGWHRSLSTTMCGLWLQRSEWRDVPGTVETPPADHENDRHHAGPCVPQPAFVGLRGPHIVPDPNGGPGAIVDG